MDSLCFKVEAWNIWKLVCATCFSFLLCKFTLCVLKCHLPDALEDSHQKMDFSSFFFLFPKEKENDSCSPLEIQTILSTVTIIIIRELSKLLFFFHEELFFLKTAAGRRVLGLDEQQVCSSSGASMLLSTLTLLTSAFYFPHSRTFLASLCHMELMLNTVAPAIT